MDSIEYTTKQLPLFTPPQKQHGYPKGHLPSNMGTGGCKRGHDSVLYICQLSGIFLCLGCKRENNANYKKRLRGVLPPKEAHPLLVCECGCGGHPIQARFLPGHRKKVGAQNLAKKVYGRRWREALRLEVLSYYGVDGHAECVLCGFADMRALSIDHIEGDGNAHRKTIKKWLCLWLKQQGFPEGFQTLCMNCQMIKASDQEERPGSFTQRYHALRQTRGMP